MALDLDGRIRVLERAWRGLTCTDIGTWDTNHEWNVAYGKLCDAVKSIITMERPAAREELARPQQAAGEDEIVVLMRECRSAASYLPHDKCDHSVNVCEVADLRERIRAAIAAYEKARKQ